MAVAVPIVRMLRAGRLACTAAPVTALLAAAAPDARPPTPDALRLYQDGQFDAARAAWLAAARSGDGDAAYHLGLMYDLGQGVASDAKAAFGWYRRAAQDGLPDAEFNVAVMLDGGRGTPHDASQAALWYARAAAHGLARAQYNLGQLYAAGEGVPRNNIAALAWFAAAAGRLPAAGARLSPPAIRHAGRTPADALPVAPELPKQDVVRDTAAAPRPLELVWTALPEPSPVRYRATVLALRDGSWTQVFDGEASVTSVLAPVVPDACLAWRVYAVAQDSPQYAASGWQRVGCGA